MSYNCSMKIFEKHEVMSEYASDLLVGLSKSKPDAVLGTNTGGTPKLAYKLWSQSGVDASGFTLIQVDQYVPIEGGERNPDNDYSLFVEKGIAGSFPEGKRPKKIYVPNCAVTTQQEIERELQEKQHESQEYERVGSEIRLINPTGALRKIHEEIKNFQRILRENPRDMQILGMCPGEYPHMGFNDYTTYPGSRTHLVELYKDTRIANSRFCEGDVDKVPKFGITEGPEDIMESTRLLLLVSGEKKSGAVASTFLSGLSQKKLEEASIRNVRLHDNLTVLMDKAAAKYIIGHLDSIKRSYEKSKKSLDIEILDN